MVKCLEALAIIGYTIVTNGRFWRLWKALCAVELEVAPENKP